MIRIKRAYDKPAPNDGVRILVDRLWPRGVSKAKLKIVRWEKDIAPSTQLRQWFGHDPKKWTEFKKRYKVELKSHAVKRKELRALAKNKTLTLIYGAKDPEHNHALVLREWLK